MLAVNDVSRYESFFRGNRNQHLQIIQLLLYQINYGHQYNISYLERRKEHVVKHWSISENSNTNRTTLLYSFAKTRFPVLWFLWVATLHNLLIKWNKTSRVRRLCWREIYLMPKLRWIHCIFMVDFALHTLEHPMNCKRCVMNANTASFKPVPS